MNPCDTRAKGSSGLAVATPREGLVEVVDVTKRFGDVVALDRVNLQINAGTFFSLLGPSGCGKTTLLRVLAGIEVPDEGRVLLDGRDITHLPSEKRPFNIVFQRYALFPHLSVYDNVAFGLTTNRRSRPPRHVLRTRVEETLELVSLGGFGSRMPAQLSGGQAQRVAVARALVRRPDMLLLDEPLSALDRNVRHAVREELLRIHSELGTTFLLVTHDQDEALSMSERVALMNAGRIEQIAEPEAMYRHPATLFTARFIGAGSFIEGRVRGRRAGRIEADVGGRLVSAVDANSGGNDKVQVLFRPEDLRLAGESEHEGLDGAAETCAFFGAYYEATVRCHVGVFRLRTSRALAPGEQVRLTWPAQAGIAYASE
jgi:spermidine/putrescine transport system ATP-binding protein